MWYVVWADAASPKLPIYNCIIICRIVKWWQTVRWKKQQPAAIDHNIFANGFENAPLESVIKRFMISIFRIA